jgi:outer membrane protein assembly factor BamB
MIRLVRGPLAVAAVAAVAALLAACSPSGSSGGQGTDSGTPFGSGTPSASVPTSAPRPPSSGAGPRAASAGWLTYHGDPGRSGYAEAPAAVHSLAVGRRTRLDGPVYAQPLVAPHGGGDVTIVATEANSVYALRDGTVVWRAQLGPPVPLAALPCGNVDPLGITGTPVVDPASSTVYVVAELDGPVRHELVAIDTATGAVRWRRGIDPPGAQPRFEQERAALALSGGRVWVALGGLYGGLRAVSRQGGGGSDERHR